ncbi:MAG: OmpA family protein [Pseudomonadota bacterium]
MLRIALFVPLILAATLLLRGVAGLTVSLVETRLERSAAAALTAIDAPWAEVAVDGIVVTLGGTAPDERTARRVVTTLAAVMPLAEIRDVMARAPAATRQPALDVEFLRRGEEVTVLGRFAGATQRARLLETLGNALPDAAVEDLSGTDAGPLPADWGPEMAVALAALAALDDAAIAVEPGRVRVEGQVSALARRRALDAELRALAGPSIALEIALRVPRRTVLPFRLALARNASGGARLEACAARSEQEAEIITAALGMLDLSAAGDSCAVGLGGPALPWGEAATAGIAALAAVAEGRLVLSGRHISLTAAPPATAAEFERAFRGLALSLPAGFVLDGRFEGPIPDASSEAARPLWLTVARDPEGMRLAGRVAGQLERRGLVQSAAARLGSAAVVAEGLAPTASAAAAEPAMASAIHEAALAVVTVLSEPAVTGSAAVGNGRAEVALTVSDAGRVATLLDALGAAMPTGIRLETAVTVDLPAAVAALPLPERACAAALNRIVVASPMVFDPGAAEITGPMAPVLVRLAAVLARCQGAVIEIGGHTDNQGRATMNERLSRRRADAVRRALRALGVTPRDARLSVRGYGEAVPVASNDTAAGRALNRRIAFRAAGIAQPGVDGAGGGQAAAPAVAGD